PQPLLKDGVMPKGRQSLLLFSIRTLFTCKAKVFPTPFAAETPQYSGRSLRNPSNIFVLVIESNLVCFPMAFSASVSHIDSSETSIGVSAKIALEENVSDIDSAKPNVGLSPLTYASAKG